MSGSPADGVPAALKLFHDAARTVPAYRDFLAGYGIDPAGVTDLTAVPLSTKDNYVRRYPLPDRVRGGDLSRAAHAVAVSSGSSGEPTVWPRSTVDELVVARRFEQALVDGFGADERSTLVVVCFALGNWVGGMYTAAACRHLADKGHPVTVATPGNNVEEILRVVRTLGGHFDQTVLAGYPPFVKNVVDAGGVDWPALHVKMLLAGEVFSEQWRDLVSARAGMAPTDSASLYGTADAGVLGNETPLSVTIRRFLADTPAAARELFGESRLPTLVQYDPADRYFETHAGTLLFTSDGGVPLVRYHLADEGGLTSYADMLAFCRDHGFAPGPGPELPFVHVFGRSLFTVSYFGANVYPENVTVALEGPAVSAWTTGRFVLRVVSDEDENRHLSVVVETVPGATPDAAVIATEVRAALLRLNSEFAHYVPAERQTPRVELRPPNDPEYFPAGVKHRYTRG